VMFSGDRSEEKRTNLEDNDVSWFEEMVMQSISSIDTIPNIVDSE
jgi:hypothetical protein